MKQLSICLLSMAWLAATVYLGMRGSVFAVLTGLMLVILTFSFLDSLD